jgi:hypothetical protein
MPWLFSSLLPYDLYQYFCPERILILLIQNQVMKRKIIIGILIVLILIQFIKPKQNNGNALGRNDFTHEIQTPDSIMRILKISCFDCHSNHTNYPWYAEINPVSWWLNHHVNEGNRELNFSEFATYSLKRKNKKLEEIAKQVKEHEMPLSSYTLMHKNAKLTETQALSLIHWAETARLEINSKVVD